MQDYKLVMSSKYVKCFATVGTTRFDRLCKCLLSLENLEALGKIGCRNLTVQVGNSDIEPGEFSKSGISITMYRFKESIVSDINAADLVISHAGAGSCLDALGSGKPLLVVVNEDLMNNHQLELAEQLQIDGHLYYCTCDTLQTTLLDVDFSQLKPLSKPNPAPFVNYLNSYFGFSNK